MKTLAAAVIVLLLWASVVKCATDAVRQAPITTVTVPARHHP